MRHANALATICAGLVLGGGCVAGVKESPPPPPASNPDSGGLGLDNPDAPICGLNSFGLRMVPPDLMIVLDKSGSMLELPDGTRCDRDPVTFPTCEPMTKWPQMTVAINNVVKQTQNSIRWGLHLFPDDNDGCAVTSTPVVEIRGVNADAIAAAMIPPPGSGRTPTRTALINAGAYLAASPDMNPKYILLATDGAPNCAPAGLTTAMPDTDGAISAVKSVVAKGIPVFVVGIGNLPDAQATLTAMAIAGERPQAADPRYYPVSSTGDLITVLETIGGLIGRCSFGFDRMPPDPTNIAVLGDGTKIPKDATHMNGWDYGTNMTSIQIYGKWCDDAKSGKLKDVKAIFGCPGITIP
jgi:hypothetical protein